MFGKRLKLLRTEQSLSQKDIAEKFNISASTIGMYEQGRRDPDTEFVTKIAHFFGVTTDYLLGKSDNPSPQQLIIPEELKGVRVAFHRGEFEDLTQDEVDALAVIARTLKAQRKGAKKDGPA